MKVTREKNCFCYTCEKAFHYLGIARHRAAHKARGENCEIGYTYGGVIKHRYKKPSAE